MDLEFKVKVQNLPDDLGHEQTEAILSLLKDMGMAVEYEIGQAARAAETVFVVVEPLATPPAPVEISEPIKE